MDHQDERVNESPPADVEPSSPDGVARDNLVGKSVARQRRERVRAYVAQGLRSPSPLEGALAAMNANLLSIEFNVSQAVLNDSGGRRLSLEDVEEQSSAIDIAVRIAKQVVQITELSRRLERERSERTQREAEARPSEEK